MGKIIIDAAIEAGVQHFVFSGMASASETTKGAVPNQAFDGTFVSSFDIHVFQCSIVSPVQTRRLTCRLHFPL